jgi:2-iminobutanoate/2-iminopropanoate deaminase
MQVVCSSDAPSPIGPYSQAIVTDQFVFCSGQIAIDPTSNSLITGGITAQTRQALTNLSAVLTTAGSSLEKVVKTTVFLQNLEDYAAFNSEYGSFFPTSPPARSTVQVAALPKGALIEIELIARL